MNKLLQKKPIIIFLMGPTAVGKTSLSIEIQKYLPLEIISVDSGLIYRGMDIGTSKPNYKELAKIPHHLIDIINPNEYYSTANFCQDALNIINKISKKNKISLLVGGTMFYFKSLLEGLSPLPPPDFNLRDEIKQMIQKKGLSEIYYRLKKIDYIAASKIHPNDSQRLIRALEICIISKKTLTEIQQLPKKKLPYNVLQFAILPLNRKLLHERIKQRFYLMLEKGFEEEAKKLFKQYNLNINLPSIRCVGYKQMWLYLNGEINYNEMINKGICATRQLAKHQITWLKKWNNIHLLKNENTKHNINLIIKTIFNF
ncbi:tRNA dimethylallyltransferase [Candidatus Providencia siddallii]|uniref:tRNA dimethylallyltransferase n=1 Tax=Candidatus Providencia siddallii TaxID=1715285 RepID=A0ABM9NPW6_9GAMM